MAALLAIRHSLRSSAIFSQNEAISDISTRNIKYILVDYYLGDVYSNLNQGDRITNLRKAKSYFESFLHHCDSLSLISSLDTPLYHALTLSDTNPEQQQNQQSLRRKDPAQERMQKIARFKRKREATQLLASLSTQLSSKRNKSKITSATNINNTEDDTTTCTINNSNNHVFELYDDEDNEEQDDNEDVIRSHILTAINISIISALEALETIHSEISLLSSMPTPSTTDSLSKKRQDEISSTRLDASSRQHQSLNRTGPLLSSNGKIMRPFMIVSENMMTSQREKFMQGVFKEGHNLPTMTVDEYLNREMERGNFLQGGTERPEKPLIDDLDFDALDLETMKQRERDEFNDANPRGWGNRYNRG